jgi:DNA-binding transcriptional MocR family regulator
LNDEFIDFVSVQLSRNAAEPLYVQLYNQLLRLIKLRQLAPGYALPPVRKFAAWLDINTGTVVNAYKELEKNGYLHSRRGSGSFVAEPPQAADQEAAALPLDIHDPEFHMVNQELINMSSISLNPDIISVEQFKQLMIEVLDRDQGHAFGYQDSQGFLPLRESIAAYLARSTIKARPQDLQIISGAQQGIDIAARALLSHGDYVLTEAPTYPGAIAAFRARGAKLIDIPLLSDGPDMQALEKNLRQFRPRLLYLMPNLQNPTGTSYSREKRARIMGLARFYGSYILEDDYLSELTYGNPPLAPLKALDRNEHVLYIKSFSKIFMPGLRLAFLDMPAKLAPKLLTVKHLTDISTSGLTQRVFDLYLRKGIWQSHIQNLRRIYETQFRFTCRNAQGLLPDTVHCHIPQGGLSLWLGLADQLDATAITEAARQNGLAITDGTDFYPRRQDHRHIRISFATLHLQEIEAGLRILQKVLATTAQDAES